MEKNNKETYWSKFTSEYEEKQSYVTGKEVISIAKEEERAFKNANQTYTRTIIWN